VRARGAYTVVITDKQRLGDDCADDIIVVPSNGPLTALLAVIPLQIIAYEMSLKKYHIAPPYPPPPPSPLLIFRVRPLAKSYLSVLIITLPVSNLRVILIVDHVLSRGIDPDKPRNLAKAVTVD
jgi:glucosamine 6-phosphate synthetase-like amidotransferase/phosphosugar isomerase protein